MLTGVRRGGFGHAAIATTLPCTGNNIRVNRLTNICIPTSVCMHCLHLGGRSIIFVNNDSRRNMPIAVHTGGRNVAMRRMISHCRGLVGGDFRSFNVSFSVCDHAASRIRGGFTSSFFHALCSGNILRRGMRRRFYSRIANRFLASHGVINAYPHYNTRNTCNSRYRGYNTALSPRRLVGPAGGGGPNRKLIGGPAGG